MPSVTLAKCMLKSVNEVLQSVAAAPIGDESYYFSVFISSYFLGYDRLYSGLYGLLLYLLSILSLHVSAIDGA